MVWMSDGCSLRESHAACLAVRTGLPALIRRRLRRRHRSARWRVDGVAVGAAQARPSVVTEDDKGVPRAPPPPQTPITSVLPSLRPQANRGDIIENQMSVVAESTQSRWPLIFIKRYSHAVKLHGASGGGGLADVFVISSVQAALSYSPAGAQCR